MTRISQDCVRVGILGKIPIYQYNKFVLPEPVMKNIDKISAFEFRENDVVLVSYPKTGTTWIQETLWLIEKEYDFEGSKEKSITERFPYLEHPTPGMTSISKQKSKRFIKTHVPPTLLNLKEDGHGNPTEKFIKTHVPPTLLNLNEDGHGNPTERCTPFPRVVFIVRDPRDVVVSYYYFARMNNLIGFNGDFDEFFDLFVKNHVPYGPLTEFYGEISRMSRSNSSRVLVIRYEDLKKNFEDEVNKMCQFLNRSPPNSRQMKLLKEHCCFNSMKTNPSVNYSDWKELGLWKEGEAEFMRKGVVGDWINHFNGRQTDIFNKTIMSSEAVKSFGYHQ